MNPSSDLSTRIWIEFRDRSKRRSLAARVVGGVLLVTVASSLLMLPRQAIAIQEVVQATSAFTSVRWKQLDEGVIRDMGSKNPARVPAFRQQVEHYVARSPRTVMIRRSEWKEWRALSRGPATRTVPFRVGGKIVKKSVPVYSYRPGKSRGLQKEDIEMQLGEIFGERQFDAFKKQKKGVEAEYRGAKVIKFEVTNPWGDVEFRTLVYADPATKRLTFYRLEVFSRAGERLFLREIDSLRYDVAAP